jgi:hypothetical protein
MARKLDATDWEILLPGKVITLGKTQIEIKPLGFEKLASILRRITEFVPKFVMQGITLDNYTEQGNLVKLTQLLMTDLPDILAEVCDLDKEDLLRLPLAPVVEILKTVIEVNVESQENLEKNLLGLGEAIGKLTKKKVEAA